ncbi:MAG: DUF4276 family protein [Candidatus Cloacimonetes bacterium]|nr:DUF4276 family protein [Candidatus Cloacimonadota bacterium]
MKILVFLLEEPSAKEMLEGVLPRILPTEIQIRYIVFQGKQDLEKHLVKKLKGWLLPESVFVVLRDQDAADCIEVKQRLVRLCHDSGKSNILIRIACRELESFYLGDLSAVESGLNLKNLKHLQKKQKYRNPDKLSSPASVLTEMTKNAYTKIAGSRAISPFLDVKHNCSPSFAALISGIQNLISKEF